MTHWKPLGTTDEQGSTCGRCGKTDLQVLVVLQHDETGEVVRVGTTCARRLIGNPKSGERTVDTAKRLQRIIDILRSDGLAEAKEWTRVRGIGCDLRRIGDPRRNIWRVRLGDEPPFIVTDTVVRRDLLA